MALTNLLLQISICDEFRIFYYRFQSMTNLLLQISNLLLRILICDEFGAIWLFGYNLCLFSKGNNFQKGKINSFYFIIAHTMVKYHGFETTNGKINCKIFIWLFASMFTSKTMKMKSRACKIFHLTFSRALLLPKPWTCNQACKIFLWLIYVHF